MAGYFGGGGGMSPGMGLSNPMASGMSPQMMMMLAQMQNGGGAGAAPQLPQPQQKSPTNAGAMPSPIASQPQNPMIQQLMQNPGMLQGLMRSLGAGGAGAGMGSYTMPAGTNGFGSSWLTPGMSFNW